MPIFDDRGVSKVHTKAQESLKGEFTPDFEREERCGFPEVIFAAGKTSRQVREIAKVLVAKHGCALATRADEECARSFLEAFDDAVYLSRSGLLFVDRRVEGILKDVDLHECGDEAELVDRLLVGGEGNTVVCCAGTSDLAVAEEAAITARFMGSAVTLIVDVGVAGVQRILSKEATLVQARAIAVVAGMEGALASLVAGLVDVPVVAVPTSVGYGASFGGLAALLGMLNSCSGGVSVVNIDNGFGAGQILDRINHPSKRLYSGKKAACIDGKD